MVDIPCTCGHSWARHDQETMTIKDWEDTPVEERKHPLEFYLKALKECAPYQTFCLIRQDKIECECKEYRQDNLAYLEIKLAEKENV